MLHNFHLSYYYYFTLVVNSPRVKTKIKTSGVNSCPDSRLRRNHAKAWSENVDRDSLKEEQNLSDIA